MPVLLLFLLCVLTHGDVDPLIIKGKEAPKGKYDYTVQLRVNLRSRSICGGTLISPNFVFTAAHCVELRDDLAVKYIIANNHRNAPNPDKSTVHKVKSIKIHPGWNTHDIVNDFALIELFDEVSYRKHVLLSSNRQYEQDGQLVSAHGWGRTITGVKSASWVLKEDDYYVLGETTCLQKYKNALSNEHPSFDVDELTLDKSWICIDSIDGESVCHGDSGGPLVAQKNNRQPILLGATSFGIKCGMKGYPTFFTRITEARDFIDTFAIGHEWDDSGNEGSDTIVDDEEEPTSSSKCWNTSFIVRLMAFVLQVHFSISSIDFL